MKILKSQIASFPDFDLKAAEHAERLRQWRDHMKRVETDKAKGDAVAPIDRHQSYDRPVAPYLIEQAIDENFNVNFELEDDSDAILRQQKNRLLAEVHRLEVNAIDAILPPGRRRMFEMREQEILAADAERVSAFMDVKRKPGLLQKLTGTAEKFDVAAVAAEQRPEKDTQHLAEQQERRERFRAIAKLAAQAMHDIEDLTADNIGAWKAPDFSGV